MATKRGTVAVKTEVPFFMITQRFRAAGASDTPRRMSGLWSQCPWGSGGPCTGMGSLGLGGALYTSQSFSGGVMKSSSRDRRRTLRMATTYMMTMNARKTRADNSLPEEATKS